MITDYELKDHGVTESVDDALRRAVHADRKAWCEFRKSGLSDKQLTAALSVACSAQSSCGPGLYWVDVVWNTSGIEIWISVKFPRTSGICYKGQALLDAVRQALELPYPGGVKQERLL